MKYIYDLSASACARRNIAGGKGAGLHRMMKLGYNVPRGFVVSSRAFDCFLDSNSLGGEVQSILQGVNSNRIAGIVAASRKLQQKLLQAVFPASLLSEINAAAKGYGKGLFAVRSSVSFEDGRMHSWAGQFDSFLDVAASDLGVHVQKCWMSLFNRRAMTYLPAAYKDVSNLRVGVVIQKMVRSTSAGVAFSIDPSCSGRNQMLIEAVRGRGDSLVSGKGHGFSAVLDKVNGRILSTRCSTPTDAKLLSASDVRRLSRQVSEIETLWHQPVDIEWAFAGRRLFLLQVRPITALETTVKKDSSTLPDVEDYELTFKVTGLSYLFTDMLSHAFKYLDPLFTSDDQGTFCQYFRKTRMEYAERFGIRWFSTPNSVELFRGEFTDFYQRSRPVLDETAGTGPLSKRSVRRFFGLMSNLLMLYSRTDNEFTDAVYLRKDGNATVAANLRALSEFKDIARALINASAIEEGSPFSQFCNRLSARFSIPRDVLECYRVDELIGLFNGSIVPSGDIDERKQSFSMFYSGGKQVFLQGQLSLSLVRSIESSSQVKPDSMLTGRVANKTQQDVVRGRVVVINVDYGRMEEMSLAMSRMKKGEVLVAEFTAPELLEACKKAKAIVTDIGGLLSHAAIVSRELGIPCLVGTGCATKAFRTGDEVVIDFNAGTVSVAGHASS